MEGLGERDLGRAACCIRVSPSPDCQLQKHPHFTDDPPNDWASKWSCNTLPLSPATSIINQENTPQANLMEAVSVEVFPR